jgi:dTDP-4-amino-4,6-dideoxygalactose transaminase
MTTSDKRNVKPVLNLQDMKSRKFTRRQIITTTSAGLLGSMLNFSFKPFGITGNVQLKKLAINGGEKVHPGNWPNWPEWDQSAEQGILEMFRSGRWWRYGDAANWYAELWEQMLLATAKELPHLLPRCCRCYVAMRCCFTLILAHIRYFWHRALPSLLTAIRKLFNIPKLKDITERKAWFHIYGLPCDMDSINKVAKSHNLKVIEDACQAWLAEYRGKRTGTLGDMGCFSFQNSKHLPAGEGGAITSNNEELIDRCHAYHNCGRPYGNENGLGKAARYEQNGSQALILMSQMKRIEKDNDLRLSNALYLDRKLKEIPGIVPYRHADGATRAVYHLYPFRYIKEEFNNVPKEKFLKALNAEGVPCSNGYGKQNKDGLIEEQLTSKGYMRLFSESRLKQWREENILPGNDRLCDQALTFYQSILLATKSDMDDIVNAITKIHENRSSLV